MSWRNDPKIRDLEPYARKHGLRYVVLFGVHQDGKRYDVTTYGVNRAHCDVAAHAGKKLQELVDDEVWPDWGGLPKPPTNARPKIVCLCGSTRFAYAFFEEGWRLTLEGCIVLSIGVCKHAEHHGAEALGPEVAEQLDQLHLRKIDLADEVLVLNIGGYVGESTAKEIRYAEQTGKPVRYLEASEMVGRK